MTQTVLVTGATGFLGSHLVRRLLQEGYRVVILKRSFSNTWRIEDVLPQLICYDIDKCDLAQPFQDVGKIDAVIHTATCYGRNQESLSSVLEANTVFPLRLLEIAGRSGTEAFLNTDTYFNKHAIPYPGLIGYSLSKKHFKDWGQQVALSGKIRVLNIILEHLFGPQEDESKFSSYVLKVCQNNLENLNLTSGEQRRDFVYVDDVILAYSTLLKNAVKSDNLYQEYEVGRGQTFSIRDFVEMVHRITKSKTILKFGAIPYRPQEIMHSQANIEPLQRLGWSPKYSLEEALQHTIDREYHTSD